MEKESVAGGVPEYELMRRAGIQAARWINDRFPDAARVVILCGGGNNGGDALVAAACLRHREVIIYSTKEKSAFSGCAACAVRDLPEKIPFIVRKTLSEADFFSGDIIVDGLLGIGFCGKELRAAIDSTDLNPDTKVFLSWGALEGNGRHRMILNSCNKSLNDRLYKKGVQPYLFRQENGNHCEADWEKQVPLFMNWLWL